MRLLSGRNRVCGAIAGSLFCASAVAQNCVNETITAAIPTDASIALQSYSYCGGNLSVVAYVKNVDYDKIVTLYWTNADGVSTPLNAFTLGFQSQANPDWSWELWGASGSLYPDGITSFVNITYQALDVGQTYVQQLGQKVIATGAAIPNSPQPPVYTAYATPKFFSDDITQWIAANNNSEAGISKTRMFNNIDIPGAAPGTVIAAQSYTAPDYAYHWVRDASLTMDVVNTMYSLTTNKARKQFYQNLLFQYAAAGAQEQNDPGLQTGLGEPKFNLDNSIFTGPWGRPQNDGPATRAITLMEFSYAYLASGGSKQTVREKLYDSNNYPKVAPMIRDLQFVATNWSSPSFDLWEEEPSDHFYTRMVQRRALVMGSQFASFMGDSALSKTLSDAAAALSATLSQFWDPLRQLILYEYGPVMRGKSSYKDIAVVLGVLHGYAGDGVYSYTNDQVLVSAYQIATSFLDVFPIATSATKDANGNPLGIAVGRYPEDVYDGVSTSLGNPWYLATSAMAELLYRASIEFATSTSITVTTTSLPFWKYFAADVNVSTTTYHIWDPQFYELLAALQGWGDAFLRRVKYHTPSNGHLTEEFNRVTGQPQGAADLTWSYAALLTASFARETARANLLYPTEIANL
ncbi:glycoside hydrolase family 15 protein [Xylona heveae TC161]|uniref:glucan 1,4-alpha-glucosidase n=1 Tax=Xylona heveae (strain CBS 132557 / TC161) TaxID=1328760 RepID=A0A165JMG6_XYLHT|nr:glycoside hydrolase family 15 protein [Xylona heveae TC161]KZF26424.1 glycoside hydrolase family 15 protein [Xylona heveae TC161]